MIKVEPYTIEDSERYLYKRDQYITKKELYEQSAYLKKTNPKADVARGPGQIAQRQLSLDFCDKRGLAIDVGARFGEWTRHLGQEFDKVIAFEPRWKWVPLLAKNVDTSNVIIYPCGLGADYGFIGDMQGNTITKTLSFDKSHLKDKMPLLPLDHFKFRKVSYLKIDVDGYELDVLKGAQRTILKSKPLIVIEQMPQSKLGLRHMEHDWYAAGQFLENLGATCVGNVEYDYIFKWV